MLLQMIGNMIILIFVIVKILFFVILIMVILCGNLKIIKNSKLRSLFCKGPKYREPQSVNWTKFLTDFSQSLRDCIVNWARSEHVEKDVLLEGEHNVLEDVKLSVNKLKKKKRRIRLICKLPDVKHYLDE
jgi:uncharacterized membrane protein YqiK